MRNIKRYLIIITILLPVRVLQAQDFSIEAESLVFNRASNIFSAPFEGFSTPITQTPFWNHLKTEDDDEKNLVLSGNLTL